MNDEKLLHRSNICSRVFSLVNTKVRKSPISKAKYGSRAVVRRRMEKSSFSRSFSLTFSLIFTDFSLALLRTQLLKAEVFLEFSSLLSAAISRLSFVGIFMKSALLCAFVSCWIFYMFLILMWISPSYELEFNAKTAFPCMLSVSMACCSWRCVSKSERIEWKRSEKSREGKKVDPIRNWIFIEKKKYTFFLSQMRESREDSLGGVCEICALFRPFQSRRGCFSRCSEHSLSFKLLWTS